MTATLTDGDGVQWLLISIEEERSVIEDSKVFIPNMYKITYRRGDYQRTESFQEVFIGKDNSYSVKDKLATKLSRAAVVYYLSINKVDLEWRAEASRKIYTSVLDAIITEFECQSYLILKEYRDIIEKHLESLK